MVTQGVLILIFESKASTLKAFDQKLTVAKIPLLITLKYIDWLQDPKYQLSMIMENFDEQLVAVRSSSRQEDTELISNAGVYETLLNVAATEIDLSNAIKSVFSSYTLDSLAPDPNDEVIIQLMVEDVSCSGVLFTRGIDDGAPYYLFNYDDETGLTDTVTSGKGISKSIFLHRGVQLQQIVSPRVRNMLALCRELEIITKCDALDIEFAIGSDEKFTFFKSGQ